VPASRAVLGTGKEEAKQRADGKKEKTEWEYRGCADQAGE